MVRRCLSGRPDRAAYLGYRYSTALRRLLLSHDIPLPASLQAPPLHRRLLGCDQTIDRVHGRAHDVDRVVGPQALGEHVSDPAASRTARTGPPAITPVPGDAGRSNTRPAPHLPRISCGSVPLRRGTTVIERRARSNALRIASATSFAFARPMPTFPFWSPTATSAENENRRPPFTTLATRVMWMTFSTRSLSRPRPAFFSPRCSLAIRTSAPLAGAHRRTL